MAKNGTLKIVGTLNRGKHITNSWKTIWKIFKIYESYLNDIPTFES